MSGTVQISGGWIAANLVTVAFLLVFPPVLAAIAHRRLGVGWRSFGYGALIFFLFQIISRVPLVTVAQAALAPALRASLPLSVAWGLFLALTAGLAEEIGRYVGYRWLMRKEEKTWAKAVMYGLGHGGLEAMLLISFLTLSTLISALVLANGGLEAVPAAQRALAARQLDALAAQPGWLPLLGIGQRACALAVQVALSVLVVQVFRRGQIRWLWLAVLAHAVVDSSAVLLPLTALGTTAQTVIGNALLLFFGLAALWVIRALREPAFAPLAPAAPPVPPIVGLHASILRGE